MAIDETTIIVIEKKNFDHIEVAIRNECVFFFVNIDHSISSSRCWVHSQVQAQVTVSLNVTFAIIHFCHKSQETCNQ